MAVSIDGPPEGEQGKGAEQARLPKSSSLENGEDAHDPRNASLMIRGLSFPFRAATMTKRSTAASSFWSSMFRTEKGGMSRQHCRLLSQHPIFQVVVLAVAGRLTIEISLEVTGPTTELCCLKHLSRKLPILS